MNTPRGVTVVVPIENTCWWRWLVWMRIAQAFPGGVSAHLLGDAVAIDVTLFLNPPQYTSWTVPPSVIAFHNPLLLPFPVRWPGEKYLSLVYYCCCPPTPLDLDAVASEKSKYDVAFRNLKKPDILGGTGSSEIARNSWLYTWPLVMLSHLSLSTNPWFLILFDSTYRLLRNISTFTTILEGNSMHM